MDQRSDVELVAVSKRFGATTAVNGVSLRIPAASYCCLLGPSGCGKTTTLRMIAGHEAVTDGDILIGGQNVTLLPPTPVPAERMDEIQQHLTAAARVSGPFVMHLSGTGTFRPVSPVVFVQVAQGLSNCELLERAVRTGPLRRELDFPYHPHVTVAQDIDDAALDQAFEGLADFVARFPVNHFVLFSRDDERRWHWRTEFPLGGGDAARA